MGTQDDHEDQPLDSRLDEGGDVALLAPPKRKGFLTHRTERVRTLKDREPGSGVSEEGERTALRIANTSLSEEMKSKDGFEWLALQSYMDAYDAIQDSNMALIAQELLRQGIILAWGAVEVLFRDAFELTVNRAPALAVELAKDASTRSRFSLRTLGLEALESHSFDLSRTMGTLLLEAVDFSDLATIKDTYKVLYPKAAELRAAFDNRDLWVLFQRRHLFVHRRGVVDAKYIAKTGDAATVGSPLVVTADMLRSHLTTARAVGVALTGVLAAPA